MKVKILRAVGPDRRYTDADTGEPDSPNKQASEPIRVLPAGTQPEPVKEKDLKYLRTVLAYDPPSKLKYLAILLAELNDEHRDNYVAATWEPTAQDLIKEGDDYILDYYTQKKDAKRLARWEVQEAERQRSHRFWVFRNKVVEVDGWETVSRDEIVVAVKHKVLSQEKAFMEMQREIELFHKLERKMPSNRESIPDDVRIYVWRRDGGLCVRCGSNQNLEYDHIIPLARGGSNTERNLQLLCESCNRKKGTAI
jgi:5-methylcytosine-specific restriction endonuclease McrA